MELERYLDHTILKPDATKEQVEKVCREALEYHFASVCVNQYRTGLAAKLLKNSDIKVCTVIGFPLGAVTTDIKVAETMAAMADGAQEIDMVMNIGALKDMDYLYVLNDIKSVKEVCENLILKVIIETCLLNDDEKKKACEIAVSAGADFVKTSTGFSTGGAKPEDVVMMKKIVGKNAMVKASGGIRNFNQAMEMINSGADRIGTSAAVDILAGQDDRYK